MLHAQSPAARRLAAMGSNVPVHGYRSGGLIDGPGDGTSDSVDIKASKGEFMLPADTTRKVGVKRLNDLIERTHAPSGRVKKAGHYADGGLVTADEERRRNNFGDAAAASRTAGIDQIPMDTHIQAPKPDGSMDSAFNTETGRNLQAIANSVGGLGGALPAVAKTGGAISSWLSRAGSAVQGASAAAVGGAGSPAAAGLLPSANASPSVNPQSSGVATPAAPGPAPTAATATPTAADVAQPAKVGWDRTNMTNAQVGQSNPSGRVRMERLADGSRSFSGDNVSGPVSYIDTAGKAVPGAGISGSGFGGFQVNPARVQAPINRGDSPPPNAAVPQFNAPQVAHSGNDWEARNNLRNLEASASSITNNGGTFDSRRGRISGPSAAQAALQDAQRADLAARGQQPGIDIAAGQINAGLQRESMQQAGSNQREAMRNDIDRGRLTLEEIASDERSRSNTRIQQAQEAVFSAQTPEKQRTAQTRLLAMMGKPESTKDRFVTAGGGTYVQDGQTVKDPVTIYDSVTQQWLRPPTSSQPTTPPPKDKLVNSQIYNLPDGRSMRWNGSGFVPLS